MLIAPRTSYLVFSKLRQSDHHRVTYMQYPPLHSLYKYLICILILYFYLLPCLESDPFLFWFLKQNSVCCFVSYCACYMRRPSRSPWFYRGTETLYSSSLCTILRSFVLFLLAQALTSAPSPRTPSVCFLPLIWCTKFHTHARQKLHFYMCLSNFFGCQTAGECTDW